MSSSLTSPALRFAANEIIQSLNKDIVKVSQFTTNFTNDAATKGTSMLIPVIVESEAGEFNRVSNNYLTVNGNLVYTPMKFANHIKHSFGFTEKDFNLVNGTGFWSKSAVATSDAISRKIANVVGGIINRTKIPKTGTDTTEFTDEDGNTITTGTTLSFSAANEVVFGASDLTKKEVAKLRKACKDAGIPVGRTILALTSVKFAELLSLLDANMYGGTEAIRSGVIPGLYGYKAIMEMDELDSSNGENLTGALIPDTAVAVAARIPEIQNPQLYLETGTVIDDKSGLTLQFRRAGDAATGDAVATGECLFGAKLIQPTKIVRLVSSATTPSDDSDSE